MTARGFTLLELLVSMTLLSLIGLVALGGIRTGTQVWSKVSDVQDRHVDQIATESFLRSLLISARPVQIRTGARTAPVLFVGGDDRLAFVGEVPSALAPAGEHLIALVVDQEDRQLQLHIRPLTRKRPELTFASEDAIATLTQGMGTPAFRYGAGAQDYAGWTNAPRLPDRVTLALPTGDLTVAFPMRTSTP